MRDELTRPVQGFGVLLVFLVSDFFYLGLCWGLGADGFHLGWGLENT